MHLHMPKCRVAVLTLQHHDTSRNARNTRVRWITVEEDEELTAEEKAVMRFQKQRMKVGNQSRPDI